MNSRATEGGAPGLLEAWALLCGDCWSAWMRTPSTAQGTTLGRTLLMRVGKPCGPANGTGAVLPGFLAAWRCWTVSWTVCPWLRHPR